MATQPWAIGLVLLASFVGSSGPIFLKKFSSHLSFKLTSLWNKWFFLGFIAYVLGTILFIPALKGGELSVLYPLVASTYVWVCLWSIRFLHEKMNAQKWIGIVLIVCGVALIGLGS